MGVQERRLKTLMTANTYPKPDTVQVCCWNIRKEKEGTAVGTVETKGGTEVWSAQLTQIEGSRDRFKGRWKSESRVALFTPDGCELLAGVASSDHR